VNKIRTIEVTVPVNEIFEGYCYVCDLQTNDKTLIDYNNKEEPICLNCKQKKSEEVA
jgi:hypothetical protein